MLDMVQKIIIYTGLGLFILGLFVLGLAITPLAILFTAPLLGLGYGAAQPVFQALVIQSAPIERAVYQQQHIFSIRYKCRCWISYTCSIS